MISGYNTNIFINNKDMSIADDKVKVNKNGLCVKINCLISS